MQSNKTFHLRSCAAIGAAALAFGLAGSAAAAPMALGFVQGETAGSVPNGNYSIDYNAYSADPAQFLAFGPKLTVGSGNTRLTFKVFVGDEYGAGTDPDFADQFSVWASTDGGSIGYNILASSSPSLGGVSIAEWGGVAAYTEVTVNLGAYSGQDIYLAFSFDPLDDVNNDFPGVRVDDIVVTDGATVLYSENFDSGTAQGFQLNGLWHVTDNFAAVPEPASLSLALVAFVGMGAAGRRRSMLRKV